MDCTNAVYPGRLPHLPSRWCFLQQKAGIALPPSDSPRLRRLTKRVINEYLGYKRFQVTALANPPTGNLPMERTEGSVPFKSIGIDFAGPIKYFSKNKKEMKATFYYTHAAQPVPSIWICYQIKQRNTCCAVWNVSYRDEDGQRKSSPIMRKPFVLASKWLKKVRQDDTGWPSKTSSDSLISVELHGGVVSSKDWLMSWSRVCTKQSETVICTGMNWKRSSWMWRQPLTTDLLVMEKKIFKCQFLPKHYAVWTAKSNSLGRINKRWRLWPQKTRQVPTEM